MRDDSALTRVAVVTVVISHEHTKVRVSRILGWVGCGLCEKLICIKPEKKCEAE